MKEFSYIYLDFNFYCFGFKHDISLDEFIILEIIACCNKYAFRQSNYHLYKITDISERTISRYINKLLNKGYIFKVSDSKQRCLMVSTKYLNKLEFYNKNRIIGTIKERWH